MNSYMSGLARLDLRAFDGDLGDVLALPAPAGEGTAALVREIVAAVREQGDAAVRRLTQRFDEVELDELRVPAEELKDALERARPDFRAALDFALSLIHISEPTRRTPISYAVFCLKK